MPVTKAELRLLSFIADDPRMRRVSPTARVLFVQLWSVFESFAQRHPGAAGEVYPQDAMLPRLCGLSAPAYQEALGELCAAQLAEVESQGGISLVSW